MQRNQNQAKALIDAVDIIVRYRWRFIVPAFAVAITVMCASLLIPRKYEAEAIFERRTDMVLAEIMSRGAPHTFVDPKQSLTQDLVGSAALDGMVDRVRDLAFEEDGTRLTKGELNELRADVNRGAIVRYEFSSKTLDTIRVQYVGEDPRLSRLAVNALVLNYIDRTRSEMAGRLTNSEAFFEKEVASARDTIEQLENDKLEFEIKNADLLPDGASDIQLMMGEAEEQYVDLQQQREAMASRIDTVRTQLATTPTEVPTEVHGQNPEYVAVARKLTEERDRLNKYIAEYKMTAKHPDVVDLKAQITATQAKLEDTPRQTVVERRMTPNPKRAELELMLGQCRADYDALVQKCKTREAQIAKLKAQTASIFPVRAEYRKLTRRIEQAQRQVAFWEENLRRVRLSLSASSGNRGVQLDFKKPCNELSMPVSPDLTHILMAAVLLSMLAGGLSVLFAYRTDESFRAGEVAAESLGLPLVGAVSEIITTHQRRMRRIRNLIVYPINAAVMGAVMIAVTSMLYFNLKQPTAYESFREAPIEFIQGQFINEEAE